MFGTPNPDDFTTGSESEMDAQLAVRFFYKEKQDNAKSLEAGRPIFTEIEFVEIRVAGKRDPQACRPATFADKKRFPRHYTAFKDRIAMPEEGTPLAEWPQIARSQVEELSFLGVKTVEQLINISDTHISNFMGGHSLKRKAAEWLEKANSAADLADKEALMDEVATLKAQMAELLAANAVKVPVAKKVVEEAKPDEEAKPANPRRRRK